MMQVRYKGEFVSLHGVIYRVEILQDADMPFESVMGLTFPSQPLTIEWGKRDKEEVVCGSTATLNIESPGDRTFEDLYTIEVGKIRMDVYRNNSLYWSGTLDAEFYEEPYERKKNYDVSLAFSDFGILDRMKYDQSGMYDIIEMVRYIIGRSGIKYSNIDYSMVSSTFNGIASVMANTISVRSDNFYDEDGEPMTLMKAIEGVLQPLAIKMIQRGGKVYLYDMNGLYTSGEERLIEWDGDSQTMGVDKVVNNVKVTFSPYGNNTLLDGKLKYKAKYSIDEYNYGGAHSSHLGSREYGSFYSYYPDYDEEHRVEGNWDYQNVDFTLFTAYDRTQGEGVDLKRGIWCHVLPVCGGAPEDDAIAYTYRMAYHQDIKAKNHLSIGGEYAHSATTDILFVSKTAYIPFLPEDQRAKYKIRVQEEILADARYNPFSGNKEGNEKDRDEFLKYNGNFAFICAKIEIIDDNGAVMCHYRNLENCVVGCNGSRGQYSGRWVDGADDGGDCWLEYYNTDDLIEDSGLRGWKKNRQAFGMGIDRNDAAKNRLKQNGTSGMSAFEGQKIDRVELYESFKNMEPGEYLPYPPCGGYLRVTICTGIDIYKNLDPKFRNALGWRFGNYNVALVKYDPLLSWLLYKAPVVDVVNSNFAYDSAELDDQEYSGYINKSAKEDMTLDTICGTSSNMSPVARGNYYDVINESPVNKIHRAGHADHPEKLLIGTLFSQYADRKTTLVGDAVISPGLYSFTEANQGEKKFMILEDVQDLQQDISEVTYCEFRPDEYGDIEEL